MISGLIILLLRGHEMDDTQVLFLLINTHNNTHKNKDNWDIQDTIMQHCVQKLIFCHSESLWVKRPTMWEAQWLRGEEVLGTREGADQKLRGWWDAWSGSGRVTALHNTYSRHRESGWEETSVLPYSQRMRNVKCSNNRHFIYSSIHLTTVYSQAGSVIDFLKFLLCIDLFISYF